MTNKLMTQAEFMARYNDANRPHFNPQFFERNDNDTIAEIEKVILSCQRDKYFTLKVMSFRVISDYEDIQRTLWEHENARLQKKKGKKPAKKMENPYDYIDLKDSDVILLEVIYYIKLNTPISERELVKPPEKREPRECTFQVLIGIPRYVEKYYVRISGNYYNPIFQIVDGSTYNNSTSTSKKQSVTMKTMFSPVRIFRNYYTLVTTTGEEIRAILYSTNLFANKSANRSVDALKYILARYNIYGAMEFLGLYDIYLLDNDIMDEEKYYNFKKDNGITVAVPKILFDKEPMLQSFVVTIFKAIIPKAKYADIFDQRYWCKVLGAEFKNMSVDKGLSVLDSLEATYDITTKESLHLPPEAKETVYDMLRWLLREFPALRLKNNLDISTKEFRIAKYYACLYAMKLVKGIYRITDEGKNIKIRQIKSAIYTPPMYLLSVLNSSKLVPYADMVNENDAIAALSFTYKGTSGLGDQGAGSAIPIIYRSIDVSHLGRVDLDASSASDPGLTGMICPMAETHGSYFTEFTEPNTWEESYRQLLEEYNNLVGKKEVLEFQRKMDLSVYDAVREDMILETLGTYKEIICPIEDINGEIDYSINKAIYSSITEWNSIHVQMNAEAPDTI